ncbi:MAG: hypothetical protein LBT86_07440 [Deltaproteobacteria bacterium]|jgi:hypothetical protein|nr:hypothetical protein [Deltaproteobacteria bacterium]
MNIINRYALKKEFYLFKLVGLVLALNIVLLLGWSREHWAQVALDELKNVTINGQPATSDDIFYDSYFHLTLLTPKASGSGGGSLPSDNLVVINGSVADSVATYIIGGLNYSSNSNNNTVILNNSANFSGFVYGGYGNGTFNATKNKVIINTTVGVEASKNYGGQVVGGYSDSGYAEENEVNFINGAIAIDIIGGETDIGTARYNKVIINGTSVQAGKLYGARSQADKGEGANLTNNTVEIYNVKDNRNITVYGAEGRIGNLANNSVMVENSSLREIYGVSIEYSGNTSGNNVLIKNSDVESYVYGSYINNNGGNSTSNSVKLDNSSADSIYGSNINYGNSTNNSVKLDNSSADSIYGSSVSEGNSTNNSVKLINSSANDIFGGQVDIAELVTDNIVDVSGGKITGAIYGGYVKHDPRSTPVASGNKVRLVGTDAVNIFGGYAYHYNVTLSK